MQRAQFYKIILATLLAFVFSACGEENQKKISSPTCKDESTRACTCDDGSPGTSRCSEAGWDLCTCSVTCETATDCSASQLCTDGTCEDDTDGDGVIDSVDNCPALANPDQADSDSDGVGDACSATNDDTDGDGILNDVDNCPDDSNADQADLDSDRIGDICDPDDDGDFVDDDVDNCPRTSNGDQSDLNNDGIGDACDQDGDGVRNLEDNCPTAGNPDQGDIDQDGRGDRCDGDRDGDEVSNPVDNCPDIPNPAQIDTNGDGDGDACDDDDDGDQILDDVDNCPLKWNRLQEDWRMNGIGDACDDPDQDGIPDKDDNCPDESNPDQAIVDADNDGLIDCVERTLGLDPNNPDGDDDGLLDGEEINLGTDPANPDSDNDGLTDGQEVSFGLDPTNPSTFNDGILDSNRPAYVLCQTASPLSTNTRTNSPGDFSLALPQTFSEWTNLTITGATAQNGYAGAVFRDPSNDVAGFVLTTNTAVTPAQRLDARASRSAQGDFRHEFVTADGYRAVRTREYSYGGTPESIRNEEFFAATPFSSVSVSNLPTLSASSTSATQGHLVALNRGGQLLVIGVFGPEGTSAVVDRLLEDVSNLSGLATATTTNKASGCTPNAPLTTRPQADIYWVLDQSGSMQDDFGRLQTAMPAFIASLGNTNFDYRFGITNMDEQIDGVIRPVPGWHTSLTSFAAELQTYVVSCQGCGSTSQYAEWGLTGAQSGLTRMQSGSNTPIRPMADVYTVFLTDEEAQSIQEEPINTPAGAALINGFTSFFAQNTVAYVAGGGTGCSTSEAYREIARSSGGFCSDLTKSMDVFLAQVREDMGGYSSPYTFPTTPISGSIKVYLDSTLVPRDKSNGWYYHAGSNSIALVGSAVPPVGASNGLVTVVYESWAP